MPRNILRFILALIAVFICSTGFAQKKFKVTVKWPADLVTDKMQVFYNNGIKSTFVDVIPGKNELTISENYISKYVTINVIVEKNNYDIEAYNIFFISDKPATIIFNPKPAKAIYKTTNAYAVRDIAKKYELFIASEEKERKTYSETKEELDSTYFSLYRKSILKKLEFIRKNKNSYYAFRLFQGEIAPLQFPNQDPLADTFPDFYKTTFSEDFRNSPEGIEITKTLESKWVGRHDNVKAPAFVITDISGNKISSDNLKDKFILINFWATWCAPCVAELPAIRQIREKYPEERLAIISMSCDKDNVRFTDALKKYKMDWINIRTDEEFASNYGGLQSIPKLFLIDNKGMIIYNRSSGKEKDYVNLQVLNEVLEKELGSN